MTTRNAPTTSKALRALVVLSGGLDSTVLAYALAGNPHVILAGSVSINYGQRHRYELTCAAKTSRALGISHHVIDLTDFGAICAGQKASALTGAEVDVPEGHYAEESMKATVVPNRNMILLALATGVAIACNCQEIAYGAHAGDHAVYPDCRPEFAAALDTAIGLADYSPPRLIRPFIQKTKADIVKHGVELRVPFADTWTCYKGTQGQIVPRPCGKCGTCVERLEAFNIAGTIDPLEYQDREYWKQVVAAAKTANATGEGKPC